MLYLSAAADCGAIHFHFQQPPSHLFTHTQDIPGKEAANEPQPPDGPQQLVLRSEDSEGGWWGGHLQVEAQLQAVHDPHQHRNAVVTGREAVAPQPKVLCVGHKPAGVMQPLGCALRLSPPLRACLHSLALVFTRMAPPPTSKTRKFPDDGGAFSHLHEKIYERS